MKIKNKIIIGVAVLFLALFVISSVASADESAWFELNPTLETGMTGTVNNCSPLTVTNGSVAAYPTCTITCNSGYDLSGSTCVVHRNSSSSRSSSSSVGRTSTVTTITPVVTTVTTTTVQTTYNFGIITLKNGSRGEAVKELQRFLNKALNLGLVVDGMLGPKTIAVIKKWQKDHGLVVDGLVGAKTKAMMNQIAKSFK